MGPDLQPLDCVSDRVENANCEGYAGRYVLFGVGKRAPWPNFAG